ncbi:hypothetical protein H8356DRAFT_1702494 [Neocallimastix lanati (nom. inval.)]|nr:hypothetical protein H8356DRAFT_1702494 [Neocallimastix sp. JGI-2020a]
MIEEPVEYVSEEMAATKEEIVELPLDESGKRRFVKRIVKYITRVNPLTGENEVIEGDSIDEPIEQFEEPICTVKEEIVEVPSEEVGKKRFVKKIMRTYIKINPITGEREIIDGNQIQKLTETSAEEQNGSSNAQRIVKYRINPITGQREIVNGSDDLIEEDIEESVTTVKEEIIEVPSNESGKKRYAKRIIRYVTKINTVTGEREVIEEEPIVEPIEKESVVVINEEIVEIPSEGSSRKSFIKRIIRYLIKINLDNGEKEILAKQIYEEPIYNVKEEIVEVPSEESKASYSKRITRYRVNPATGEREVIDEQEISNEQAEDKFEGKDTEGVREEIVEIPSDEMGKSKFVKRIIKYVTRIDPVTGKKEVIEEDPIEESIDQSEEPETSIKEEVVEVPSDVKGKSVLVKRTIKYIYRVNPYTGEKEVAGEQTFEEPFEDISEEFEILNEDIIEAPYSEPSKRKFQKRTIKYTVNVHPITGDRDVVGKQQMDKPIQDLEEPVSLVKEEIVEVQSEIPGQRKFVKKIKNYNVKVDPITGEKKVIDEQNVEETIEGFKYRSLNEINSHNVEVFTEGNSIENREDIKQSSYREYEDYIDNNKRVVDESVTFKNQNDSSYNHLTDQKSIDENDDECIEVENHVVEQDVHPQDLSTSSEKHDLKKNLASVSEETEKTNVADESSKKQIEHKKSSKKNVKKVSKKGENTVAENGECIIM